MPSSSSLVPCGAAAAVGVCLWVTQEWFIHAKLFHGNVEWFGKEIHHAHHLEPYYHISIDGADIAVPFMLLSSTLLTLLAGQAAGTTVAIGYICMGMCYQFVHYAVHTRALPKSQLGKIIRQNHMQHHCRNENYWLSFTAPAFDTWYASALHTASCSACPHALSAHLGDQHACTCLPDSKPLLSDHTRLLATHVHHTEATCSFYATTTCYTETCQRMQ